jgi:hypothetical protein
LTLDVRCALAHDIAMPRTARASVGGVCYHVINRGNGRTAVFRSAADCAAFTDLLVAAHERLPWPDRAGPRASLRRERKRGSGQASRSQAVLLNRARSWPTISACRWPTRDSLTPKTAPIADIVSFSS